MSNVHHTSHKMKLVLIVAECNVNEDTIIIEEFSGGCFNSSRV